MTAQRTFFDDLRDTPEQDVKSFADVMSTPLGDEAMPGLEGDDLGRIRSGRPDKVKTPILSLQASGRIQIEHGWDDEDYVWHIEPSRGKTWKVSLNRVIYAIAKTMNEVVPSTIPVKIFKPSMEWEIKVITFKAMGLKSCWNVRTGDLEALAERLFVVLGTLV